MVEACAELQTTPAKLMLACGGLKNAKDFHLSKFCLSIFRKGVAFRRREFAEFAGSFADRQCRGIFD